MKKSSLFSVHKQIKKLLSLFGKLNIIFLFLGFFLCSIFCIFFSPKILPTLSENAFPFKTNKKIPYKFTVVIDPGHGGRDPGKVGYAGALEKEINLQIALYLKALLETQDIKVILTRDRDEDLAVTSDNFKISDMKERVDAINQSKADLVVSVHQNSYTDPKIQGAQCFYCTNSEEGKQLASILQRQIILSTQQTKIREMKENGDYYLLKHSSIPAVIVECGFLSNPEEEKLLITKEYQHKIAWGIHLAILQYLNLN